MRRDDERCIRCRVCERQCGFDVHHYDEEDDSLYCDDEKCVACHRCVVFCPTGALTVEKNPLSYRENYSWRPEAIEDLMKQAETGGILLTGMGNDKPYPIYWDKLLLNASQVTNPSIDPLREPMELRTYLGRKPDRIDLAAGNIGRWTRRAPQVAIETPIMFSAISYGAISLNVQESLARAATEYGTFFNTGEGGLHKSLYKYSDNAIVQVASGRFGVHQEYLDAARVVEIKIGQGAKPGIGGHLPGEKVTAAIAATRMIPEGSDALSPAPHHDIYSIEDLAQLIGALKEATGYSKPVGVKIAAVHHIAAIASGAVRAGADFLTIDGFRGGTGAAPKVIRNHMGLPIELGLAAVDDRLRQEGIRNQVTLIASGGIRSSADMVKAIALGADAVAIGTAALVALGCTLCQACHTGRCAWGLTTQDEALVARQDVAEGIERVTNLLHAWSVELREMLGALGINAVESLRGNRERLRAVGLDAGTLEVLGVQPAGKE